MKNLLKDVISCDTCKCLIKKEDAQKIELKFIDFFRSRLLTLYYCKKDKKNYDRRKNDFGRDRYFKEMEVSKDGEPIGYKKITK